MDLVSTIRKEGSRGGVDFKWSDVATSNHRENYLGHSLMAPVGRWQKGRDLTWYSKSTEKGEDGETETERAARERREEIRRIKEAEEDALARALGLPVQPRVSGDATGANSIEVGEMNRIIKEAEADDNDDLHKGLGGMDPRGGEVEEIQEGSGGPELNPRKSRPQESRRGRDRDRDRDRKDRRSRSREHRHRRHRHRSRSGDRDRNRGRYRSRSRDRHERRHRSRDRRERRRRSRSRDGRGKVDGLTGEHSSRRHHRSRSPAARETRNYR